ncbi:MAG TPA: redoxin family protein [Vicinamibacterales bacterium]|jgi:cytochrome c biogenesis protein CcmG/thiol:disulfide interchange protein DsbE
MNRFVLFIGAIITTALVTVLMSGLGRDPKHIDSPLLGNAAPRFTLKTVGAGTAIDTATLRGKPLVVNFWATWCVPCWEEQPILNDAARIYGDRVQFLGVVFQDDESKIRDFLRERGAAYPTVIDDHGKTAIAYGVGGVPETFFVDANGTIVAKYDGPLSPEQLKTYLDQVLQ